MLKEELLLLKKLLHLYAFGGLLVVGELVEVQVPVDISTVGVDGLRVSGVLGRGWQLTQDGCDRCDFGGGEIDVGALSESVREVSRGRGDGGGLFGDSGLVSHAQGATWHLQSRSRGAERGIVSLLDQLRFVHLRRRRDPQSGGDSCGFFFGVRCSSGFF